MSNLVDTHLGNVLTNNSKEIVKYSCLQMCIRLKEEKLTQNINTKDSETIFHKKNATIKPKPLQAVIGHIFGFRYITKTRFYSET